MRNSKFLYLFLVLTTWVYAQKQITIDQIYRGYFRTENLEELQVLHKSNTYAVLEEEGSGMSINLYDFATRKKIETIFSTAAFPETKAGIDGFQFSEDDKYILITAGSTPIYRHSFLARYFLYDTVSKQLTAITEDLIQEPQLSPDGSKICFARENNLFLFDVRSKAVSAITTDGVKNKIINGITDWVYEEEFAFVKAYQWSTDSKTIGFIRFDESEVPEFTMNVYGQNLYPGNETFKYPKAGEANAKVSLHLFDVVQQATKKVDLTGYTDFYIPRIKWSADARFLSVQILNRHQNKLDFYFVDAQTAEKKLLFTETDKAYIDITDNLTFLSKNRFIWSSEKDGFNHLYLYGSDGKLINQITQGNWEVTAYYGFDEKTKRVFYQSTEEGSINRTISSIGIDGKNRKKLSQQVGTNGATFSPVFTHFINNFHDSATPPQVSLNDAVTGKSIQVLLRNEALRSRVAEFKMPEKVFMTVKSADGQDLNAWMVKPTDFDAKKKYPLFMYQYSGPGSQQVSNSWNDYDDYWFKMLAQQGYIVVCVDGRGTGFKGAAFKKCTQGDLGNLEVQDQIFAAKSLAKFDYIDANRIGIFGWSYGGFMSANCLLKGSDIFKMAIAVAPVTNWRFYDSIYTERYLTTPQENAKGYDDNSPINFVKQLKGKFLLVHGTADDNVHVQNSMRMIEALVQANKQFDWAIYPDKNHGIYGGMTRIQLYNKMTDFIKNNL